jgi:mitochondrial intermembrane space import and assembly protein 40
MSRDGSGTEDAVNAETGEINWDCPCLKSALEPPCGEYFKAAFTCFVNSKTEPKGLDCREVFSEMQRCFQEHPEKYAHEEADASSMIDET